MQELEKSIAATVAQAIDSQAKAALLTALGGTDRVAEAMLNSLVNKKVDRNYRKVSLLDATLEEQVQASIKELVSSIFTENKEQIQAELAKRIKLDSKSLAEAIMSSIFKDNRFYLSVNVKALDS